MPGLFGSPRRLPQIDTSRMGIMPGDQPYPGMGDFPMGGSPQTAPQAPRKPGFADKLSQIGDILISYGQGHPTLRQEMAARQQVEEQSMRARQLLAQQQRQWGNEDWQQRYDYERANPKPSVAQPYRWESNDGDVYQLGPNNQPQRVFDDPSPRMNFIPDGMGGGQWVPMPGATPSMGGAAPTAPVGRLTPIEPAESTPMYSGGNHVTRQQFQAIVATKGVQGAADWARRNNIQVRD